MWAVHHPFHWPHFRVKVTTDFVASSPSSQVWKSSQHRRPTIDWMFVSPPQFIILTTMGWYSEVEGGKSFWEVIRSWEQSSSYFTEETPESSFIPLPQEGTARWRPAINQGAGAHQIPNFLVPRLWSSSCQNWEIQVVLLCGILLYSPDRGKRWSDFPRDLE